MAHTLGWWRRRRRQGPSLYVSEDAIRLAARLRASLAPSQQVVLFTGAAPGDGVSSIVSQVALAWGQMDLGPVLLVDANLRRPSLHERYDVEPVPGLADLIMRKASLEEVVHGTALGSLSLLPHGNELEEPITLFSSPAYGEVAAAWRAKFRLIAVDSCPMLEFSDTALITPNSDAVVLVVAAGERRRSEVREAQRLLEGLKANVLGVVLFDRSRNRPS